MKAVYYIGNQQVEMRDIPKPQPGEGEYLIRITACGVCGSDYEGFLGKTGRRTPPLIMGHEFAGVVEQGIPGGKYAPGSQVVVFPKLYCGVCPDCRRGAVNLCADAKLLGCVDCDGAMTEYCCIPEQFLIPFTGDSAVAAMAEPTAVAYNGVYKISEEALKQAEHILVVGAGTIGLLAMLLLKYRGAKHVIVSDMSDYRLELAKSMGADAVLSPAAGDFEEGISRLTNGAMCDLSIEAVGISPTAANSLLALRRSGTAIWIGNAAKDVTINMQRVVTTELTINGSYIYSKKDFDDSVALLAEGAIDIKPLLSEYLPLERGAEAFEMLGNNKDGRIVKIIITNP